MSQYFQMVIEFEVPDDYNKEGFKSTIDYLIGSGLPDNKCFISTIKPSAKANFNKIKKEIK